MQLKATIQGNDPLDLKGVCQKHIDDLWVPKHLDGEQAVRFALDVNRSRRAMAVILSVPFQPRYNGDDRQSSKEDEKAKNAGRRYGSCRRG